VTEALAADRHAAAGGRDVAVALRDALQAWRSLGWRQWVAALATGLVVGLGQTLVELATVAGDEPDASPWALLVFAAVKMMPMYLAAAALLLPGLAVLERRERGTPAFASHAALIVLVAIVAGALGHFTHPLGMRALLALGMSHPFSALEFTWSSALLFSLLRSMSLLIVLSLATLVYVYLSNSRRTARRLAAAQVRHSEAERRLLAEQLTGTQALVEPALLFDTLRLVEELFERNAEAAQRLLDALIAYLRAALPAADDSGSTVGQQIELVRARLEIERIRLGGRLAFRIDVPDALARRPLAPLLLTPLATNAVRHGIEPAGGGEVMVQARQIEDRLVLEVSDSGAGRAGAIREGASLVGVRERLARLYGERAQLVLADREPHGLCARLEVAEVRER
jgi:hypothetical protein